MCATFVVPHGYIVTTVLVIHLLILLIFLCFLWSPLFGVVATHAAKVFGG